MYTHRCVYISFSLFMIVIFHTVSILNRYHILPCIMHTFLPKFLREKYGCAFYTGKMIIYHRHQIPCIMHTKCRCALYMGKYGTYLHAHIYTHTYTVYTYICLCTHVHMSPGNNETISQYSLISCFQ